MQIGNRFRFYPSPAQAQTLLAWIGCQRFIYNAKVGEDRYFRRFARQSLIHTGAFAPIDQQYSHFKTEQTPWLGDVPSQILRNGAVLCRASACWPKNATRRAGSAVRRGAAKVQRTCSKPNERWRAISVMALTCAGIWRTRPALIWQLIRGN